MQPEAKHGAPDESLPLTDGGNPVAVTVPDGAGPGSTIQVTIYGQPLVVQVHVLCNQLTPLAMRGPWFLSFRTGTFIATCVLIAFVLQVPEGVSPGQQFLVNPPVAVVVATAAAGAPAPIPQDMTAPVP